MTDVDAAIVATSMMFEIHDLGPGSTWCGYFDEDQTPAEHHTIYKDMDDFLTVY